MMFKRGFSLVEITIVLLVLSVLAAGGLSVYQHHDSTSRTAVTLERIEAIERAFADFRSVQHRLPCPADPTLREHEAGFGAAGETPGNCQSGEIRAYAREGHTAVGAVPTRALKLPDSHMYDGWGRRFTYYVDSRVTGPMALLEYGASDECVGSIRVNDSTGTARTERAIYALVSHGLNGHGAFLPSGERRNANSSNAAERANAGVNAALADNYGQPLVKQRPTRNSSNHADSFDDIVRYKERWAIFGGADGVKSVANSNKREYFTYLVGGTTPCGLTNRGNVYCWGSSPLGNGTNSASSVPVRVHIPASAGGAAALFKQCFIGMDSQLYCWGNNSALGDNVQRRVPELVSMPEGFEGWKTISRLPYCGVSKAGRGFCWPKSYPTLPVGNRVGALTEITMPDGLTVKEIEVSSYHACLIASNDRVYCWGQGQLLGVNRSASPQNGTLSEVMLPSEVKVASMSIDTRSTCVLTTDGEIYCWGFNSEGQLGSGNTSTYLVPVKVSKPHGVNAFRSISIYAPPVTEHPYACALADNGKAYCWGANTHGQLGDGTTIARYTPTEVKHPPEISGFRSITAGSSAMSCGIGSNGRPYCWGDNGNGAIGIGHDVTPVTEPTQVILPANVRNFSQIARFSIIPGSTCALGDDRNAYCWGNGGYLGRYLGNGEEGAKHAPYPVNQDVMRCSY